MARRGPWDTMGVGKTQQFGENIPFSSLLIRRSKSKIIYTSRFLPKKQDYIRSFPTSKVLSAVWLDSWLKYATNKGSYPGALSLAVTRLVFLNCFKIDLVPKCPIAVRQ